MSFLSILATAASTAAPAAGATGQAPPHPGWVGQLIQLAPLILLGVFFMFIMTSSKRKQERERKTLMDGLKRGDKVRLIGGEFGSVVDVKDAKVQIKVDESSNTKIWYAKEAVQAVEKDTKEETK